MSREIQLTQGYVALVDDEDFTRVSKHTWTLVRSRCGNIYAQHKFYGKLHRFVMKLPRRIDPKKWIIVDHRDGNGLNNQKVNLRITNQSINSLNRKKHCGVYWKKSHKAWTATTRINGKSIFLYQGKDLFEAWCTRKSADIHYGG